MLGYGFPESSFLKGVDRRPHVIAVDAGSTDSGPHKLGAGTGIAGREAERRDLGLILAAGRRLDIPVIIGSAGGAGARVHVERTVGLIEEIAREHRLAFETAVIHADVGKAYVRDRMARGAVRPLGPAPELTESSLESTERIVGQMGAEPILAALEHGAQLIVAGRAFDPAPFAALPIREGFDPALAFHLGKILECGALCAEPGTAKDAILGTLRRDHFIVEPLGEERRCRPTSVAAHTLYEKDHPYHLHGPGLELHLEDCRFTPVSDRAVRVSGSRLTVPAEYTIKLEGAARAAFRTIIVAGVRDPILVERIDEITRGTVDSVRRQFPGVPRSAYRILFHVYGRDGVMGEREPHPTTAHELGIVVDVTADTQELASTIAASTRSTMLHYPCPGRKSTAGNLAFPFSPADIETGPVYRFTVYHLVTVEDPLELFPIEYRTLP